MFVCTSVRLLCLCMCAHICEGARVCLQLYIIYIYIIIYIFPPAVMVVKYSVQVYQRDLFLTGDTHQTYIQLIGTRGSSHKVRLADWSVSGTVR